MFSILQGCKIYRHCIVALLDIKLKFGGSKAAKAVPSVRTEKPPAGRKGAFDRAQPVKSAFALLSEKVTKPAPIGAYIANMEVENYWRERLVA